MTDRNHTSVSATLENAIALAVSRAQAIVDDGTANSEGLAAADPDELADALTAANVLVSKLEDMRHGIALAAIDRRCEPEQPEPPASGKDAPGLRRALGLVDAELGDAFDDSEEEGFVRGAKFILEKLRDDLRGMLNDPGAADAQPEQPDDLHNDIGRAWNEAMQQLYAVRDLAHLLDVADDRAETVGYVIEREAERGVECMNALERLLWKRRQEDDEQRAVDNADDLESRAYARGLRDGLWQADQSIRQAVKDLRIDRMNSDGSFADDKQEPGK